MKNSILLILFLFSLSLCKQVNAQGPSLGFDTSQGAPNFPDTVILGDPASFTLKIKNWGNSSFSGAFSIERQIKDSTGSIVDSATIISTQQAAIAQGTIFNYTFADTFSLARHFFVGIDVVVIWPKAAGTATHDSLTYVVHVLSPNSVSNLLAENGISVYPNPCSDLLIIENKRPENPIEQVRIYDMKGKLILSKNRDELIDLSQLQNALYMVELKYKSGMRKILKVQKQE